MHACDACRIVARDAAFRGRQVTRHAGTGDHAELLSLCIPQRRPPTIDLERAGSFLECTLQHSFTTSRPATCRGSHSRQRLQVRIAALERARSFAYALLELGVPGPN